MHVFVVLFCMLKRLKRFRMGVCIWVRDLEREHLEGQNENGVSLIETNTPYSTIISSPPAVAISSVHSFLEPNLEHNLELNYIHCRLSICSCPCDPLVVSCAITGCCCLVGRVCYGAIPLPFVSFRHGRDCPRCYKAILIIRPSSSIDRFLRGHTSQPTENARSIASLVEYGAQALQ